VVLGRRARKSQLVSPPSAALNHLNTVARPTSSAVAISSGFRPSCRIWSALFTFDASVFGGRGSLPFIFCRKAAGA
jgi:hypothetical protein